MGGGRGLPLRIARQEGLGPSLALALMDAADKSTALLMTSEGALFKTSSLSVYPLSDRLTLPRRKRPYSKNLPSAPPAHIATPTLHKDRRTTMKLRAKGG
eukprot:6099118-Amphidinium_carterae.2